MSVELSSQSADTGTAAAVIGETVIADDDDLEAIWNKNERDNGAEREGGKFVSPDPDKRVSAGAEGAPLEGGEGGEPAGDGSTPGAASVPLPANWQGIQGGVAQNIQEAWAKTPPELQSFVAQREQELQSRLSDHGRQLSALKPVGEVIDRYGHYFTPDSGFQIDGKPITPAQGVEYLFSVQKAMDQAPVETIMQIIDKYAIRDRIAAAFGKSIPEGEAELRSEIAGLKQMLASVHNPAALDDRINRKFQEQAEATAAEQELGRLSSDKPLYSEIPEPDMVESIHKARRKLGDAASKEAVFNLAYDMAVNADPDLRAKAAAMKTAAPGNPSKVADAKRAAAVNIPSTTSGKGRALTEDEELAAAYDRTQKG